MLRTYLLAGLILGARIACPQVAIQGETVYTMAGQPIRNGVVLIGESGKIDRVGPASLVSVPAGYRSLKAKVVTPGLVDAHTVVGFTGYLNQPQDQEQVERSSSEQPELRAIDGYDAQERLIEWVRGLGVTTMHTGHGPGVLISGQTMIVKTTGANAEQAVMVREAMIATTLGQEARAREPGRSPGSRSRMIAMLRSDLVKAQEYSKKKPEARDLRVEALVPVVNGEKPLLVTVQKAEDILSAIRLGKEFHIKLVLDGAADAHLVLDEIKSSGYPVFLHPTMARSFGDTANLSRETAAKLKAKAIPFALQSGFESYVPKTRVVLWEAAQAAANGLAFEDALASITVDAAKLLGIDNRVGSLQPGKDGDVAMYDGDPFEYTSHCTGVLIAGKVVSDIVR